MIKKAYLKLVFILTVSFAFFLTFNAFSAAGGKPPKNDTVEITKVDVSKLRSFNGSHATVFGIALGMGKAALKEKIKTYAFLKLAPDAFNPKRFYLQDASVDTGSITIGYLIWPNYDTGLYQIILYPAMSNYLKGGFSDVVSPACIDPHSEIYKFLGDPSAKKVTSDIPSIKSKTTDMYYPKYNIVIEESQSDDKIQYNLVLTRKW